MMRLLAYRNQFAHDITGMSSLRFFSSSMAVNQLPRDTGWLAPEAQFYGNQQPWHDRYCRQRSVIPIGIRFPAIAVDAHIAASAVVIGDVDVYSQATIMHGAVVRGDLNSIKIAMAAAIQENCVIHAARNGPTGLPASTNIGAYATIGAGSLLRSCQIGYGALIGERSIVLEGSVIGEKAILLPGTVVPPARTIPKREVWSGNPAKFVRNVSDDEGLESTELAEGYAKWSDLYAAEELPVGNAWKKAEALDPVEDRLFPQGVPPEWAVATR